MNVYVVTLFSPYDIKIRAFDEFDDAFAWLETTRDMLPIGTSFSDNKIYFNCTNERRKYQFGYIERVRVHQHV